MTQVRWKPVESIDLTNINASEPNLVLGVTDMTLTLVDWSSGERVEHYFEMPADVRVCRAVVSDLEQSSPLLRGIVCPPDENYDEETIAIVKVSGEASLYDIVGEVVVDEETGKGAIVLWKDYAIALSSAIEAALAQASEGES